MKSILRLMLMWFAFTIQTTPALAQEQGDYQTTHKAWNGLSTFAALAAGEGLEVVERTQIDWSELDSDDVLVLIYPTNYVDPANVVSFIRNGGRVLIADDFGAADLILAELGGHRSQQFRAESYQDNQVFAPIATPTGDHALSAGIVSLTTNHPSVIEDLEGMQSIFAFESGDSVVATGEIGMGRYVALADPSVLINRMLQFEGNLAFAINLLRYLIRSHESDRIIVLSGAITMDGLPRNRYDDGTWQGSVSANVAQFDGWLDEINLWLLTGRSLRILTLLAALGLAALLFLAIPASRHKPLDGAWTRAAAPSAGTASDLMKKYSAPGTRMSYLLPAAIARDNVNAAIELATGEVDPFYTLSETDLLSLLADKRGHQAAKALRALLPRMRRIPQRAQAAAHWQPRFVSLREFEELHGGAQAFFEALETTKQTRAS